MSDEEGEGREQSNWDFQDSSQGRIIPIVGIVGSTRGSPSALREGAGIRHSQSVVLVSSVYGR